MCNFRKKIQKFYKLHVFSRNFQYVYIALFCPIFQRTISKKIRQRRAAKRSLLLSTQWKITNPLPQHMKSQDFLSSQLRYPCQVLPLRQGLRQDHHSKSGDHPILIQRLKKKSPLLCQPKIPWKICNFFFFIFPYLGRLHFPGFFPYLICFSLHMIYAKFMLQDK